MSIISPIALATDGYVCDGKVEPIAIGILGVLCVSGFIPAVQATVRAMRRTIQLTSIGILGRRR